MKLDAKKYTPEDYIVQDGDTGNALACTLCRAEAVIDLIADNGSDLSEGFALPHKIIMDALWTVSGLIRQAKNLSENSG